VLLCRLSKPLVTGRYQSLLRGYAATSVAGAHCSSLHSCGVSRRGRLCPGLAHLSFRGVQPSPLGQGLQLQLQRTAICIRHQIKGRWRQWLLLPLCQTLKLLNSVEVFATLATLSLWMRALTQSQRTGVSYLPPQEQRR